MSGAWLAWNSVACLPPPLPTTLGFPLAFLTPVSHPSMTQQQLPAHPPLCCQNPLKASMQKSGEQTHRNPSENLPAGRGRPGRHDAHGAETLIPGEAAGGQRGGYDSTTGGHTWLLACHQALRDCPRISWDSDFESSGDSSGDSVSHCCPARLAWPRLVSLRRAIMDSWQDGQLNDRLTRTPVRSHIAQHTQGKSSIPCLLC